jgi:hypothetical protein
MAKLNTYFLEKETVDGVVRAWYEVDGNEYAVASNIDYGSGFYALKTLLDVEGRPIARITTDGHIHISSDVPQHIHDVVAAINECRLAA